MRKPNKKHALSLFIFRRDLRLTDNTGLIAALKSSEKVIPLFIFTPTQIANNQYKSENAIQFMIESLKDLDTQIKKRCRGCRLWVAYGEELTIIQNIYKKYHIDAIYVNEDYTPYSNTRDLKIAAFCRKSKIEFNSLTDILLLGDTAVVTAQGHPYLVFGMFYKRAVAVPVRKPDAYKGNNFKAPPLSTSWPTIDSLDRVFLKKGYYHINPDIAIHGGRTLAIKIIKKTSMLKSYHKTMEYPVDHTTMLSAHNKFGTISIREEFYAFKSDTSGELRRKLYWRDFYYYVSIQVPKFFSYQHLVKNLRKPSGSKTSKKSKAKKNVLWENRKSYLTAWKTAKTGFPIVDAAMVQLNTTGYIHNRARLIVSEFLVKDLLVDWRYGERHFARKLVDIDRIQNTGNWNWSASFGLDATPYLRIFNPWNQSKKYDPKCLYIKKWLPQFEDVPAAHIHRWETYHEKYPKVHPKPIVNHATRQQIFKKAYKTYFINKTVSK